jgi:anaerobic magnesium-protoporphyrin IX monomethyl ester cyclase
MSTITLINPPGIKTFSSIQMQTPGPPLGLAYIAGMLKKSGRPYCVIDAVGEGLDQISAYDARPDMKMQGLSYEEIVARIPADTDIIGMTCMFSTLWPITRGLAQRVRTRFPTALMVLGGEHGTAVPEHALRTGAFDIVALGEGVDTIERIVETYRIVGFDREAWGGIHGIAYLDAQTQFRSTGLAARKTAVDEIPLPDWDSIPIRGYVERHQLSGANIGPSMPLLATWGCPYQCTFCSNPGMWTQRWIPRSPKLVVDEMEAYARKYGVTNFDFQDLTTMIKRDWIMEFTRELIDRRLNVTWQLPSGTRAEVFDDEVAAWLYEAGLRLLAFAPETGSERMIKLIKKQVDLREMLTAMRCAIKSGLKLSCFIVIGFPGETRQSLRDTLSLIRRMAWLGVHDVAVTKFVPYPGSELFKHLQASGRLKLDDEFFIMPMDFYTSRAPSYADGISSRRMYLTMLWMFVNFYAISLTRRPWRVVSAAAGVVTGRETTRLVKWLNDVLVVRRRWNRQYVSGLRQTSAAARRP